MILRFGYLTIFCLMLLTPRNFAQEPVTEPTPPENPIRIVTEEVQLNVTAQNSAGHFDPTLVADDLLVTENGAPQKIESLRRAAPASVLLLLDTGSELNFAKNLTLTRLAAKLVALNAPDESFSVVQYHDKVETLADWTNKREEVFAALDQKLFGGRRSRLVEATNSALEKFKSRPLENRHLILISDGAESTADEELRGAAFQKLLASNITVHVLSYTRLEEQAHQASKRVKINKEKTKPRIPEWLAEQIAQALPDNGPNSPRKMFKAMNKAQRIIILNLDNEQIKRVRKKREEWLESEGEMKNLANDTGGVFDAPDSAEMMLISATEIGKAIGSQYVVAYAPQRPYADSSADELRQVRVVSRRVGLQVRARQKVVLANQTK